MMKIGLRLELLTCEEHNDRRADCAEEGLLAHCRAVTGDRPIGEPDDQTVMALLTDLQHYCARQRIDFEQALGGARYNYHTETVECAHGSTN